MEEQIFDANHPVNVEIKEEPIVELLPELEQKIEPGETVIVPATKRTIHCDQCNEDINSKAEKYDKRVLIMHQRNKVLCKALRATPNPE